MSVLFHRTTVKHNGFQNVLFDVSRRKMPALMTSQPLMTPEKMQKEVPELVCLTSAIMLQSERERRLRWWMATPLFLEGLLHKLPDLRVSCLLWSWPKDTDWVFDTLSTLYLETQTSFGQYCIQSAVAVKDLRTETSIFHSGGKKKDSL